jgi:SAM-dependent methyltransferase
VIVKPEHFRYLYVQRGEVADVYKHGFDHWKAAYEASLQAVEASVAASLPRTCREILDVGGGLGGIGVLLSRRYPTAGYRILDGVDDPPEVRRHARTFSNARVATDFLTANEVPDFGFYKPCDEFDRRFDLVVSFAAWCFHIPPDEYLARVRSALAPGATVILDVRSAKPEWFRVLNAAFGDGRIVETGKKHTRCVWRT